MDERRGVPPRCNQLLEVRQRALGAVTARSPPEQGTVGLADRDVIVTGASSGIGEATARLLRAADPDPVLVARRSDRLGALSNDLGGASAVSADVARPDDRAPDHCGGSRAGQHRGGGIHVRHRRPNVRLCSLS